MFKRKGFNMNFQLSYKQDNFKSKVMHQYRQKRLQMLKEDQVPDLSEEVDLDIVDMQDHKFLMDEKIEIYYKNTEKVISVRIENVLDEMILYKSEIVHQNVYNNCEWASCDSDKLLPPLVFKNLY